MSTSILRLVPRTDREDDDHVALPPPREEVQLSLFDIRPVRRILCLPMADIHGSIFRDAVSVSRPWVVVDLRAFPYFDLSSLSRRLALRLLDDATSKYVHAPLDLRPPQDQAGRWRLRQLAEEAFANFATSFASYDRPALVLLHRTVEIEILDSALRGVSTDRDMPWMVEPHGAMATTRRA